MRVWGHGGHDGRLKAGVAVALAGAALAPTAVAASAPARPITTRTVGAVATRGATRPLEPSAGDWEGVGPHGLRMSFQLAGRGRTAKVPHAAVSLPDGCRSAREGGFSTVNLTRVAYYPPTRAPVLLPGGAFTIKAPRDFAIVGTDVDVPKYPVVVTGSLRSARSGVASVPVYSFRCPPGTGWSRVSRFALKRGRRPAVQDSVYNGDVTGPEPGITGTVKATVVGGGRVLTDFSVAYRCPTGLGSSFELGPSAAAGEFIGPDGNVEEHWTPAGTWSGRFMAGRLTGTFTDALPDCTQNTPTVFAATLG